MGPAALALVVPFGVLAAGLILGWFWLRTQSIWIVSLAHGALNNWGQYAFKYLKGSAAPDRDMIVLGFGSAVLLIVGTCLLRRVDTPQSDVP